MFNKPTLLAFFFIGAAVLYQYYKSIGLIDDVPDRRYHRSDGAASGGRRIAIG